MRPQRLARQAGRYALVDGVPFQLPINSEKTPALMAGFRINLDRAREAMPGNELHPFNFFGKGLFIVTVIDYRVTDIGKYIEYSLAIACTHGPRPAPTLLSMLFQKAYGVGQYVVDLPVSSEVSVKGGKGIWGMPKHRASLDFLISQTTVSSQYNLDNQLVTRIDIERPGGIALPLNLGAINYCAFRGMLMKSYIYFKGRAQFALMRNARATLTLGDHPRAQQLRKLEIEPSPVFTAYLPDTAGVLDDHCESWFLSYDQPPSDRSEGLESVIGLGRSEEWLPPPRPQQSEQSQHLLARSS
jgi:hypothetical protein